MKKLVGVIAFLSVFTLFGCNNDSEKSDDSVFEGFGIELDSEIKPNTSRLIPIKNETVYKNAVYDLSFTTVRLFPINLYEDEACNTLWTANDSNGKDKLYYKADSINDSKLIEIIGDTNSSRAANSRQAVYDDAKLYIIGDLSEDYKQFLEIPYSDGKFIYTFTYSNTMGSWGQGDGNLAFLITSAPNYEHRCYGGKQVLEMSKNYSSKINAGKNNSITGMVDGNEYKIVITYFDENEIVFHVEGELGAPTLKRGLQIRGSNTKWEYAEVQKKDDGSFYYEFTYDVEMDNTANESATWKRNDRYKKAAYFTIMPVNAYYLGSFSDVGDEGELSTETVRIGDAKETTFTYNEAHNFVFADLELNKTYRINISAPTGSLIEETVYTVSFEEVTL
ncbi:MAG: hypothetical protein PUE59_07695 [Treponema sp.]|nr:hypothetical protein [Treponema sp.]